MATARGTGKGRSRMTGESFVAELRAKPKKRNDLMRLQIEMKLLVHQLEPVVIVYELFQSEEDLELFIRFATFRDHTAWQHHMPIDFQLNGNVSWRESEWQSLEISWVAVYAKKKQNK